MPCHPFQLGEARGFICTRSARPARCVKCGGASSRACDYPLKKRDCDAKLCPACAMQIPDGAGFFDYCPTHAGHVFSIGAQRLLVINKHSLTEPRAGAVIVDVMRGTPLGNPYKLGEMEREKILPKFKSYLWQKMQNETEQMHELNRICELLMAQDVWLSCCCAPRLCHAQIIAKAVQWLMRK